MPDFDGLELESVTKLFGDVRAVDAVSLSVRQAEFLTLLGPSGSGKTTTLRIVAGFAQPTSGIVRIAGTDMTRTPPHRRNVGMVFQNYALFPHMSVSENIAYPLRMRGIAGAERERRVNETLGLVQLDGLGNRRPRQLSGGQQQRVALARAIVFEPRVLLMDEPLGALDKKLRESLQLEIRRLHKDLGMTVLYVTHDQEEALVMSDRIALFNHGRIVQIGTASDLYEHPASVFVAAFVGDSNIWRGRLEQADGRLRVVAGTNLVPCEPQPGVPIELGTEAAVVIRPEHIDLVDLGIPGRGDEVSADGRVREVIYLGAYVKYEIEALGQIFQVRREAFGEAHPYAIGTRLQLRWRLAHGLLVHL